MAKVFPAQRIITSERHSDPMTGKLTESLPGRSFFYIDDAAENYIDEVVGRRFDLALPFFLMNLTSVPNAWAAVFFTEIIKNSDDVLEARADLHDELLFATYGEAQPGMRNPPLGAMVVMSPERLRAASSRHEVFRKAWDALSSCTPNKNWVAVVDV